MIIFCGYIILVNQADEEMKKEQERRVTEDKKDSVHQQLLHTVCNATLIHAHLIDFPL